MNSESGGGVVVDQVYVDESNLDETLLQIACHVRPEWASDPKSVIFKEERNGLTNRTIHAYSTESTTDSIMIRVYRPGSERIVSRDEEVRALLEMSQHGLGPALLSRFKNGICCQYLPGNSVSLLTLYKEEVWQRIAEAMAKMHLIQLESNSQDKEAFVFKKLREMMSLLSRDYTKSIPGMTERYLNTIPAWNVIEQEIELMRDLIKSKIQEKLVYCHNDLNFGNIIWNSTTSGQEVKFIDFEYVGVNYAAYEIANYFNEFIGIYDASPLFYPTRKYQTNFVRVYLTTRMRKRDQVDDDRVNEMLDQVRLLTPISHLMWAVWSLVEAQDSNVDFDLIKYAQLKFDQYFRTKQNI